ncbi:TPA: glycosyltransferase family 4 protein [Klebsiella pneumoniae]|nr:glycosyltransferase family 4 protein [Klebsiella pneumoniae]
MKKILFISHENGLGGGTRSLISLIKIFFTEKEYDVTVLIKKKNTALARELDKLGIKYLIAPHFWIKTKKRNVLINIGKQIFNLAVSLYLVGIRRVSTKNFDIIHSNSSVVSIGLILAALTGIKHVWHFREFGDLDFELSYPLKDKIMFKMFNKYTAEYIFISTALSNHFHSLVPVNHTNIVYNGFEIKQICNSFKFFDPTCVNLLISGSFSPGKKQDTAIKAIAKLKRLGLNVELTLAGDGNPTFRNYLINLAEEEKISNFIHFIGYQTDMDKVRGNADIELVCSRAEAFGRVTIEAMLAGVLVIASNTGANTELINHGENGLLYKYDDADDLAIKISMVINHPEMYSIITNTAFHTSYNKFSIVNTVKGVCSVYRKLDKY